MLRRTGSGVVATTLGWLVAIALCLAVWQSAHSFVPLFQLFLTVVAEPAAMMPVVVLWQPLVLPA